MSRKIRGMIPPKVEDSKMFDVNRRNQVEAIWQPLYDFQTYANAGTTKTYTFFAVPNGQSGKTQQDTNMEVAAVLPAPKEMLVTHIEVVLLPGGNPSPAAAATGPSDHWNDMYSMMNGGYVDFFIGSKSYLTDAPIGKFSNSFRLSGESAMSDTTTAGATGHAQVGYASFAGPLYEITPIKIVANQNFNVTLNFPTTLAMPSGVDARIGVILGGFLYRLSQ